ncbi:serine/threonine-protein phosphatase 7 long form homolog [Nicotiana tabacum]|uniref:Serine/threonine-protein phosphatase 7 long form homolog n=1 Tax=Nicotiana tabacum TaxID=4097 RepID=A0AC58S5Y1_TOBAC
MALIERWQPETHTFHLPIGEATITLQDVQVLYGLPADGLAVALPQYMRSMMRAQYLDLLQQFIGFRPHGEAAASGGSHISVTAIRQHLEVLHPDITGEIDDLHIHRYTSWGAAVLTYLYKSMCRASMGTQSDVCGFLPLLQVWVWERFLPLQPALPPLPPDVAPPFLPLARRWVLRRGNYRAIDAHHNLPLFRDVLDMLEASQVADGPTTPSTDPASSTDDDPTTYPYIKRRHDEDDRDSVPRRQGMRLRPVAALKHTGCGTH